MGQIKRCGRQVKRCACIGVILLYCLGCTTSGPVVTRAEKSPQQTSQRAPSSKADRLLNVQVQEQPVEILLRLSANGPFQDYQLKKLGDSQFALELGDITNKANLPTLPTPGSMQLSYGGNQAAPGVRLLGSLNGHLDRYVLNAAGNDLVLGLYVSNDQVSPSVVGEEPARHASYVPPKKKARIKSSPASTKAPSVAKAAAATEERSQGADGEQTSTSLMRTKYTGKPISLDLMDADLRNVLRLLADISGTNIAVEPDVTGKVTLKVEQVPWDQVLDMVLTMNDLGKVQVGNVIRVAKQEALKKEWDQQKETLKAKQDFVDAAKDLGGISTAYLTVNYAPAADMAAKIKEIMSDKGRISVDDRTSLIIYSDYDSRIDNARRLIARLDKATPQVLIEARIVTVQSDLDRNLGVQLSMQMSHHSGQRLDSPISGGNANPFTQAFQINNMVGNLFGFQLAEVIGQSLANVDLRISALETASEAKVMAAPKVLTLNNVKAVISQGTQIPYAQFNEFGTAVGTQFVNAILELSVTPHITPDRRVRLQISAKQDEPSATVTGIQGQPGIDTRKIDTELLVDDGSVIVIGGVIRNSSSASKTATPGLHKVPIIGRLFKTEEKKQSNQELLIFISPRIVDSSRMPERS